MAEVPFKPEPITLERARLRQVNAEARYAGVPYPWIVLGDSRASDWPEDLLGRFGRPVANLGLPGAAVQHLLWQIAQTQLDLSGVRQAIVVAGINHLTVGHEPQHVAQGLQQVVRALRARAPDAEALVVEIFPRTPGDAYTEAARRELNRRLANRAAGSGLFRVGPTRLDNPADGRLFRDGLHLTRAGYEILTEDVRTALGAAPGDAAVYLRQDMGEVIVLADLGEGLSLIEDMPAVVEALSAGNDLEARRLIGREPDGRWFGVDTAGGRLQGLWPIGYMPLAEAIILARARIRPPDDA